VTLEELLRRVRERYSEEEVFECRLSASAATFKAMPLVDDEGAWMTAYLETFRRALQAVLSRPLSPNRYRMF
jgi:hypothetical protein